MITLKIKYSTTQDNLNTIKEYQRQYTICYKVIAKFVSKGLTTKEIKEKLKTYKNVDLILSNSWFMNCLFFDVKCLNKENVCFNKGLLLQRMKNLITAEEYKQRKHFKLCSNGEKDKKCNRFFKINEDLSVLFKPNAKTHLTLNLQSIGKNRIKILNKLYELQQTNNILPITYYLDSNYVYMVYDETLVEFKECKKIQNRIFAIDMNPNYIGYSVIDWKDTENLNFKIVDKGVVTLKSLNDKIFSLKGKGISSNSKVKIKLSNKRTFECYEVAKYLVNLAKHFGCEIFAMEDLSIKSNDKGLGKKFNSLCNNLWNRNKLENNIQKRCNIIGIKLQRVVANWSSVLGNTLYRNTNLPDMVLSSIEISRRAQEFSLQYLKQQKEKQKNIIFPNLTEKVRKLLIQTMEVLDCNFQFEKVNDFCYSLKKNLGNKYRVPLEESRVFRQNYIRFQVILFNNV